MKKIKYIRQQGPDCVVCQDDARVVIQNCDANKLANTLLNRLGPKYSSSEMYKFGFIPET
jgi:hypothetical protein